MIDPVYKSDLQVVRDAFEEKAVASDQKNAELVPLATVMRTTTDTHAAIQEGLKTYPSSYAANASKTDSIVDRLQKECIPCLARLHSLPKLDLGSALLNTLDGFNIGKLLQLKSIFDQLSGPSDVDRELCSVYQALKSQCIPDITRMLAALAFLINDIRSIDLPRDVGSFLSIVLGMISKLFVRQAMNLDKFDQLITGTLDCVLNDIKAQMAKLEPILSGANREKTAQMFKDAWHASLTRAAKYDAISTSGVNKQLAKVSAVASRVSGTVETVIDTSLGRLVDEANKRIRFYLDQASKEILKLTKTDLDMLESTTESIRKIKNAMSVIQLLKALLGVGSGEMDPCGGHGKASRVFAQMTLPGRTVVVDTVDPGGTDDGRHDTIITIVPDPVKIDNPVVADILARAGVRVVKLDDGTMTAQAEPVAISLFGCLGPATESE